MASLKKVRTMSGQCPTCGGSGFVPDDNDDNEEIIRTVDAKGMSAKGQRATAEAGSSASQWPAADSIRPVDITSSVTRRSWVAVSPPPGMCRRTEWRARAASMPQDASGGFRAAGLGPVAGRPASAEASGTPLLLGKHSDDQ